MLQLRFAFAPARGWPAASAALLWALAAGSVVFWWLHSPQFDARSNQAVRETAAAAGTSNGAAVARALGQASVSVSVSVAAPDAQRRFQLLGVIAADSGHGSALLMVDGQPARAFVQGQDVGEGWRLQSVSASGVRLSAGQGGATLDLALPVKP